MKKTKSDKSVKSVKSILNITAIQVLSSDLKALSGSAIPLSVVLSLYDNDYNVTDMCGILNIDQSILSHHLKILRLRGFIDCKRVAKFNYYHATDKLKGLMSEIKKMVDGKSDKNGKVE